MTYRPARPDSELIASWFNAAGFSANSHRRRADVNKKCIALWYIWACLGLRYRTVIVLPKGIDFLKNICFLLIRSKILWSMIWPWKQIKTGLIFIRQQVAKIIDKPTSFVFFARFIKPDPEWSSLVFYKIIVSLSERKLKNYFFCFNRLQTDWHPHSNLIIENLMLSIKLLLEWLNVTELG